MESHQQQRRERSSLGRQGHEAHTQPSNRRSTTKDYRIDPEEEEYDRRREEELKRQINAKESEIQHLSKASDYLRTKLDTSMITSQRQTAQIDDRAKYASFGRQVPERDRSPIGTERRADMQMSASSVPSAPLREHIANLQSDNASLMRRLNLVLQELDRVQKEKEDIQQRQLLVQKDSQSLQRIIAGEDNTDKMNKYMNDDLSYEKDRNQKLQQRIKGEEIYKNDMIRELNQIEDDQEKQVHTSQNMTSELHKRVNHIQDLEKEHYYTQDKIKQVGNAIELVKREEMVDYGEKSDLQRIISQLLQERNELLTKLDNLTIRYDDCVREISQDRAEMEFHNSHHSKLVTAKIIFQELSAIEKRRLQSSFNEMILYCQFDSKCHGKLQTFANAMDRIGKFRLRIAIRQWFQKSLKPLEAKIQSQRIAEKIQKGGRKQKMFYAWRGQYQRRIDAYDQKTKAIQLIWQVQTKDVKVEKKRAFTIWRELLQQFKQRKLKIKRLIWNQYFTKVHTSFTQWISHCQNIESQVRYSLLSRQFTQKQYLSLLFSNLKYQSCEAKRKRLNILFHCLKEWRDTINYKKFLMGAQVSVFHFQRSGNTSLLKQCFDAMRQNKEEEKFQKTNFQLNEEERPLIQDLTNEIQFKSNDQFEKNKLRACNYLSTQANKRINEYFSKWKQIYVDFKTVPSTKMKDRIIKVYFQTMRQAFSYWRKNAQEKNIQQQQVVIMEEQESQKELTQNVQQMQKEINNKQEQRDCSGKKGVQKCVKSLERRQVKQALLRWREKITELNAKESGAGTVINRMRKRFLRQAFDLYLKGVQYKKKLQIEEERCAYYNKTRDERLKVKIFNAWRIFKKNFTAAKHKWFRVFCNVELSMQQQAFKKWREQSRKKEEFELQETQNEIINGVSELNSEMGKIHEVETQQLQQLQSMKQQLTKQAQRILSNTFAHFYYLGQSRGFEKWKEYNKFQKHKSSIILKTIDHMRKQQFYRVKSVFATWMLNQDINERREQVKKEEFKIKGINHDLEQQSKALKNADNRVNNDLANMQLEKEKYNKRLQKCIGMIVNKVDGNHYISQKRHIMQQWREYVRREKFFISCIQNVIQKSLWTFAFKQIREFSRQDSKQEKLSTVLNRFRLKFWKRTCSNAFSKWKSGAFATITQMMCESNDEINNIIEQHEAKKTQIKVNNSNKASKSIGGFYLRNLFHAWRNVKGHFKQNSTKTQEFKAQNRVEQIRNALIKWRMRQEATRLARMRLGRYNNWQSKFKKAMVFKAMQAQFFAAKDFMKRMSNLANIHDHQALKIGYNTISSYVRAKKYVFEKKKEHSAIEIYGILNNLLLRKKNQYLNELKYRTLDTYKQNVYKAYTVLHNVSNKMRIYFQRWREQSDNEKLVEELNDEGPVREEVFEQKMLLQNYKCLMKDEGFDQDDVKKTLVIGDLKHQQMMLKVVRRLQHYNEDLYTKPKFFDRWRQYVQMRKMFKYQLKFVEHRSQYHKSDIAAAFYKWKRHEQVQLNKFNQMNKQQLDSRVLQNSNKLGNMADEIQQKEATLNHLCDQRDELVENYIKGQKLALSLWCNRIREAKHQAFLRWFKNAGIIRNGDLDAQLRKNIQLIAALKEKVRAFEGENNDLASENEELRQFSLDGYEIAKNVQTLTHEREKLSVDLADKAQTIRKLLDENEKLNRALGQAQEEAQNLIKSTNKKFMGSGAGMPHQQQMMRSNVY